MGGQHHAQDHRALAYTIQVTGVCNMTWECPNYFEEEFHYLKLPTATRTPDRDVVAGLFHRTAAFVDACRQVRGGGAVLIHSVSGRGRAPAAAMYYLMLREKMPLAQAYALVAGLHPPGVVLSAAFAKQLLADERVLFGAQSARLADLLAANKDEQNKDEQNDGDNGGGGGDGDGGGDKDKEGGGDESERGARSDSRRRKTRSVRLGNFLSAGLSAGAGLKRLLSSPRIIKEDD